MPDPTDHWSPLHPLAAPPRYTLVTGDAIDCLRRIPDESIDLVVTDPAYESLEKHRKIGTTTRLKGAWFDIFPNWRFPELFHHFFRVLKKGSHCYVHCDQPTGLLIRPIAEQAGFTFWKYLVWDKMKIGMGYHYRARHEWIAFFEKGKRKLNDLSQPDVLAVPSLRGKQFYPTEKPVELEEILIRQSSDAGDTVLDPFMGAGSVGRAAIGLERRFLGCDSSSDAIDVTRKHLTKIEGSMSTSGDDGVSLGKVMVAAETKAAIMLKSSDHHINKQWIPRSVIHDESDVPSDAEEQDSGELIITRWFAEKNGLG